MFLSDLMARTAEETITCLMKALVINHGSANIMSNLFSNIERKYWMERYESLFGSAYFI